MQPLIKTCLWLMYKIGALGATEREGGVGKREWEERKSTVLLVESPVTQSRRERVNPSDGCIASGVEVSGGELVFWGGGGSGGYGIRGVHVAFGCGLTPYCTVCTPYLPDSVGASPPCLQLTWSTLGDAFSCPLPTSHAARQAGERGKTERSRPRVRLLL